MFIFESLDENVKIKTFTLDFVSQTFVGDIIEVISCKNATEPQYFVGNVGEKLIFKALVEVE
jgi:hypothetical protein